MNTLIIVESPTKAKTISKFLPKGYTVKSSMGHIRDLPKKEMGIDIENNFEPTYIIPEKSKDTVAELKKIVKKSDHVILATDEDREGEAIAWHLAQALHLNKKNSQRIAFHEITKKAILEALEHPREINEDLVDAQQARRMLDRLVGYELSPFLWKKIQYGLSAGRVQSVALRIICDREDEIGKFNPQEYWTIEGDFKKKGSKDENIFPGKLSKEDDKTLDKFAIGDEKHAKKIMSDLKDATYTIDKITKKETTKNPPTPFTTSTLQQEAFHKLGYSSKKTMIIAQQLYEGIKLGSEGEVGLISYMRTDSHNLSETVISETRKYIETNLGKEYLPEKPNIYKTKTKGAQEAHEAIRPTSPEKQPTEIKSHLKPDQFKLYDLIWRRTVACQMNPAIFNSTSIDITAKKYTFRAHGSTIKFDGYLKVYKTSTKEKLLPELSEKDDLLAQKMEPIRHFTEPPARYSEATLIKLLEEHEIGRPSTYAPTMSTILDRKYVIKNDDKKFEPTDIGKLVNKTLVEHFNDIVDIDFTAKLEEDLDQIALSKKKWQPILKDFYEPFKKNLVKKDKDITKKELTEEETDEKCDKCNKPMLIKMGRFGKFMACSDYPECKNTKPLEEGEENSNETEEKCDKCNADMVVKTGRFGKFLACSNYPECKTTKQITKKDEPPLKIDKKCSECGGEMVVKMGKFGRFLACSNYPDCKHIESVTTGIKCPECNKGEIAEKRGKGGKTFYSCTKYPDCKFSLWTKPTGEKCPKCKSLMVFAAKGIHRCGNKECKYEIESKES